MMKKLGGFLLTLAIIIAIVWLLRMFFDGTLTTAKIQAIITLVIEGAKIVLLVLVDAVIIIFWLLWQVLYYVTAQKITPPPATPPLLPLF